MRRLKLILACVLICSCASGQRTDRNGRNAHSHFGAHISPMLTSGETGISFGHAFSRHWSITGEADIYIPGFRNDRTVEETEHYKELYGYDRTDRDKASDMISGTASIAYWPVESLHGIYLSIGLKYGDRTGADCRIGIGYMFPIWKMINADITYCIDMVGTRMDETIQGKGMTIGINIIF